jgi:methanogenic corrinoid protein MtbC1
MHDSRMGRLIEAILEGDSEESVREAGRLSMRGVSTEDMVVNGVEAAMSELDAKCTSEEFNLLEIMLAGRAVTEVMKLLHPAGGSPGRIKGKVVIATLEGDIHDLGKNILKMVLVGSGYQVVDCGRDCPLERFIDTIEKENPSAVGISGLITPVIPLVRKVKDELQKRRLGHLKIMAGGATLKQSSPAALNVDFVAESAFDSLRYLKEIAGGAQ